LLASLLPGLREVRTPLAVGYLWLLVTWLQFADRVPRLRPEGGRLVPALFDLENLLGHGAVLAAASFLAYLIGALLSLPLEGRVATRLFDAIRPDVRDSRGARDEYQEVLFQLQVLVNKNQAGLGDDLAQELSRDLARIPSREDLRIRLLVASESLYGEYDRLSAEAAFRVNIAPPLVTISWLVGLQAGFGWGLAGTVLSAFLAYQGVRRRNLSDEILRRAVVAEVIQLPVAAKIGQAIAEHP
jgi:hypothetical protein